MDPRHGAAGNSDQQPQTKKKKRGRPKKADRVASASADGTPAAPAMPRVSAPKEAAETMAVRTRQQPIGQTVHGVVEGFFDVGYLVKVRLGDSDVVFRGVIFDPHMSLRVEGKLDIAPDVQSISSASQPPSLAPFPSLTANHDPSPALALPSTAPDANHDMQSISSALPPPSLPLLSSLTVNHDPLPALVPPSTAPGANYDHRVSPSTVPAANHGLHALRPPPLAASQALGASGGDGSRIARPTAHRSSFANPSLSNIIYPAGSQVGLGHGMFPSEGHSYNLPYLSGSGAGDCATGRYPYREDEQGASPLPSL